jgi:hypothetical protein
VGQGLVAEAHRSPSDRSSAHCTPGSDIHLAADIGLAVEPGLDLTVREGSQASKHTQRVQLLGPRLSVSAAMFRYGSRGSETD